MNALEVADIQGIILSGYNHLRYSNYLFLRVIDANKAKPWLRRIADDITVSLKPDAEGKLKPNLNLAITASGLKVLGLPEKSFKTFGLEFQQGMADEERSRILGDTGDSAPGKWELGGPNNPEIHVLLMLFATDESSRATFRDQQRQAFAEAGLQEISSQDAFRPEDNKEPFGFRDGISQPGIKEFGGGGGSLRAGEFIMGYTNEFEKMPFSPTIEKTLDKNGQLPLDADDASLKDLGKNGSYLVLRKLQQDVTEFKKYFEEQSKNGKGEADSQMADWLAAKCVGRWPSGAPLALSPEKDNPELSTANNFNFLPADSKGTGCPMGSHIRRSNPRDSLIPNPEESVKMVNRHRIIRRGRVYRNGQGNTQDTGIFFIAINANIRRQFEFIQQTWINDPKFDGGYSEPDPLAADNDGTGHFVIPMDPVRKRITGIPRFVQVRGGEYFFLPGIKTLRFLGSL